ncbi:Dabb family protein [Microbacterium schleiferi]|uniref:Dabb family protein n=1 Tax=Microbacterium schleiferi TaxID=69362 RepID=UPI001D179B6A|nr:Dabb family protein [Microbacterium schleiferi]MCC4266320.1 Dabb family protein [Microbacterium schleiferi]
MILHLASFRWVDSVTEDDVSRLTAALTAMAAQIPELRSYIAGPNLHLRPGGMDYAVAAIVDDEAGLHTYLDHPAHAQVYADLMGDMLADRAAAQLPLAAGSLS